MTNTDVLNKLSAAGLFEAFSKTSECGVIFVHAESEQAVLDPKAKTMLGLSLDSTDGYITHISHVLSELRSGSDYTEKEITVKKTGKQRIIRASGANLYAGDKYAGSLISLFDATASVERERLQAEFINHISHEFRTPLTTMKEFTSILLDGLGGATTPEQQKYLGIIQNNIQRLARMVDELLDISKLEAGKTKITKEPAHPGRLLTRVCFFMNNYVEAKQLKLIAKSDDDLPVVFIDIDRMIQVLTNLIDNAAKNTPPGGRIEAGASKKDGFVEFYVSDTGEGIDEANKKKIFDKFFQQSMQKSDRTRGIGLGLAITKQIILMHGGKICVDSEPGRGSVFTFSIPLSEHPLELEEYLKQSVQLSRVMDRSFSILGISVQKDDKILTGELFEKIKLGLRKPSDSNPIMLGKCVLIGLPDTSRPQCEMLFGRLEETFSPELRRLTGHKIAVFPEDADSSDGLINIIINK